MKQIPFILVVAGAFVPAVASGQFSIDWWTIDGGGGTSRGGDFSLSGTIAQSDAGAPQQGGDFEVTGGYWPGVPTVIQTPDAPQLRIMKDSETGEMTIIWPLPDDGFELRSSRSLGQAPTPWSSVAPLLVQTDPTGSFRFIVVTNPMGRNYFKLFPTTP